jgi:hypothetical protein
VPDTRAAVRKFLAGQRAAGDRQRALLREEGPRPERAVAEFLSMLNLMADAGIWPGPRDPVAERDVEEVRRLWVRVKRRAGRGRRR